MREIKMTVAKEAEMLQKRNHEKMQRARVM